jgi:ABC-2 type transport system ATP-binding protein
MYSICQSGLLTGRLAAGDRDWLESRGPGVTWADRVRTPTLVLGGTVDTLFTLAEATENFRVLRSNDVPARMMWFCGGHGTCRTGRGPEAYWERAILRWLNTYVKGDGPAATDARFEWVDQHGDWHGASNYPLADAGSLTAGGSRTLQLVSGDAGSSGTATSATPSANGIDLPIPAPDSGASLVGAPSLEIVYRGQGTTAQARAFAQIVDEDRDIVIGGQVTPLPLELDNQDHTLRVNLETLAYALSPSSSLRLEIVPASNVYGSQRSNGRVELKQISLTLPLGKDPGGGDGNATPPPRNGSCVPSLSPRSVKRRDDGRVRIRPRVRCGGRRLRKRVKISDGRRNWSRRTGKAHLLRVRPKAHRLVIRFRHSGARHKVRVPIKA